MKKKKDVIIDAPTTGIVLQPPPPRIEVGTLRKFIKINWPYLLVLCYTIAIAEIASSLIYYPLNLLLKILFYIFSYIIGIFAVVHYIREETKIFN